jgi:hypothetical protein
MPNDNQQHDGEIVRLDKPDNGRSCNMRKCCGRHLHVGDIVRFKVVVLDVCYEDTDEGVEPDQRLEQVVKAVVIVDGTEMCTVGFLPRHVAARQAQVAVLNNKLAQIIELYNNARAGTARHNKSLRNKGWLLTFYWIMFQ